MKKEHTQKWLAQPAGGVAFAPGVERKPSLHTASRLKLLRVLADISSTGFAGQRWSCAGKAAYEGE
jgi:hypothetical protein